MPVENTDLNLEAAEETTEQVTAAEATPLVQEPVQEQVESTPSLPQGLMARAQQAGLPLDGINDTESLASAILDQFVQSRPYAEYGRSALSNADPRREPAYEGHQDQPEQVDFDEQDYFSKAWTVPTLSPGAEFALKHGAFTENDKGMIIPAAGLEQIALPYIKEINDYQQAQLQQNESFRQNPVKFMAEKLLPYFEHKLSGRFQEYTQERFQEHEHRNFEEKFKAENTWLFDERGGLSQDGVKFRDTVAQLRAQGIRDPQVLADYAIKLAGISTTKQEPQQAAQEVQGRVRDEHGRFVPAGKPAPAPTKQESFIEKARRNAAAAGSQSGHGESGGDYVVANEGELENMFTAAFKKHAAGV